MFEINATQKRVDVSSTLSSTTWTLGLELLCTVSTTYSHYNNTTLFNICQIKKRTSETSRCSHLKKFRKENQLFSLEDREGFEPTIIELQSIALTKLGYRSIKGVEIGCNN